MTPETQKYNGWTNYETWLVNLWLDNDEGDQAYWNEQAQAACADNETKDEAENALAHELSNWLGEAADERVGSSGMMADLLSAAIQTVDCCEIAAHWIADNWEDKQQDETEEEKTIA